MDDNEGTELAPSVVDAKVAEYERFIEKVLRVQLQRALDAYQSDAACLEQCRQLRQNLELFLRDDVRELETMVELGCQIYGRAFVPDTSNIFVNVGLGFHLEMPLKDASEFLEHKEDHLQRGLEYRKQRMAQIKADIHEALHLIDLLVQIRSGGTPWWDGAGQSLVDSLAG
eukprot:TRINITY_DN6422_c0_g1_i4.p2 TRINITY_DN6422_c0_g1~~TRINITY_DN6422_c0_g1_i4.p2  ORF type:complete len:171 (-),score=48.57 TRINITY_DN6422_c0_g1_i4:260-772(-)